MIKLIDLIKEAEQEPKIFVGGPFGEPEEKFDDEDMVKRGFRTKEVGVDPETGAVISQVEYLPKFDQIRRDILKHRKEFQPFKYHSTESIAKNAKELNTLLTKASQMIFALEKMIELERKTK